MRGDQRPGRRRAGPHERDEHQEAIEPQGGKTVAEAIENNLRAVEEQAKRTGKKMLVHLNHPNFGYAITAEDIASVIRERFFEVYNGHPGVNHLRRQEPRRASSKSGTSPTRCALPSSTRRRLYRRRHRRQPCITTANPGVIPGRGWIMVRAANLEPETLIKAIKAGELYASSGVTLRDVRYDAAQEDTCTRYQARRRRDYTPPSSSARKSATTTCPNRVTLTIKKANHSARPAKYSHDVGLVLATSRTLKPEYQLTGKELYVRAVVTSSKAADGPGVQESKAAGMDATCGLGGSDERREKIRR